jgi:putative methyltransferase
LINASTILRDERKLSSFNLVLVLVHDLLLRDGIQAADGPIKQAVIRHKTRLNGELVKIKIKRGARSIMELAQPEDARAGLFGSLIKLSVRFTSSCNSSYSALRACKYREMDHQGGAPVVPFAGVSAIWTIPVQVGPKNTIVIRRYRSDNYVLSRGFVQDDHIADLLSFSPQTQFHNDPPYKSGKIILQDKASCFPAVILAPPATDGASVIGEPGLSFLSGTFLKCAMEMRPPPQATRLRI